MQKKITLLHRYPRNQIVETNAAFPYLEAKGIDVLTFKKFDRLSSRKKFWKSLAWVFYAPLLVWGKGYDVIYCDDSYPFYPALVKLFSPKSKVVIRLGDLHLMYYYSGWAYKFLHFFEKIAWGMADEILSISEPMREYVGRGKVVLDPVDVSKFEPLGVSNAGHVMFHGVLTRNKNVDLLLSAAHRMPKTVFFIVGNGPDRERLQRSAPKNVIFGGWVPFCEMQDWIDRCAVGVALRSDNPGNEYVVTSPFLQYGASGKPCLVTRRKVFGDYPWQFSGVNEMVDKLTELLKRPEEGEKLRQYIVKNHDAKKIAEAIWKILQSQS